ncbi:MAG: GAF domain-containing protein [Candidatus Viridilinea halotolerans]|uniref:GAF domain-containing protein n=1 Tax=Candidatus Viridilinea halotolerans TaxID=2491704 RepID=A0A426U8A5_9CHLR|nr:MAG: GAF domain-containing protein [Candidatus Viridilinea halotolerans]
MGIGVTLQSNPTATRATRLREALLGYGAFLAAARRPDPLPILHDLACDWLRVATLRIDVPAGVQAIHSDDPQRLCGPILIGRQVIGRIEAQRQRPFDEDDQALLNALGHIIGAALEYASLQAQLSDWAGDIRTHNDTIDQLLAFGRAVIRGPNEPLALARQIATEVPAMLGGERASVLILPNESFDQPVLMRSDGHLSGPERTREVTNHGLISLVLRERVPMIIDETDTDQRWIGMRMDAYEDDARTRCAMAAPLLWGARPIGALTVTTSASRLFNPKQLNLLELIACHTALAVQAANHEARLSATAAGLGAMAIYLDIALDEARQGNLAALEMVAVVSERLRAEQQALMSRWEERRTRER